jgi:hypothetical protein
MHRLRTWRAPVAVAPHSPIQNRTFAGDDSMGTPTQMRQRSCSPRCRASSIQSRNASEASGGCVRNVVAPASAFASSFAALRSVTGLPAAQSSRAGSMARDCCNAAAVRRRSMELGRSLL